MICFEVIINGEKICTAGTDERGHIFAMFSYVRRVIEEKMNEESNEPRLTVGGHNVGVASEWTSGVLEIGDEVTIKIVEADKFDAPVREFPDDPEELERRKREYYEQLKREYEGA